MIGRADSIFHMALLFWVVMDSLGCLPIFVSLLKHFSPARQRAIIIREMLIALTVMIAALFFGQRFFYFLDISPSSLQLAGGSILFIIAVQMIFSTSKTTKKGRPPKEPLIVPLAVPAIAGPALLATITLYSGGLASDLTVLISICIAWGASLPILLFSPFIHKILGENGIVAIERLFGYIIVLIATQMAVNGLRSFLHLPLM